MNQKLRDAHRKHSVDFFRQCQISKRKWNFIKLGNRKQGINEEIEIDGAKNVDKKATSNAFNQVFADMGQNCPDFVPLNTHKLDHCSEKFSLRVLTLKEIYKTNDKLENGKTLSRTCPCVGFKDSKIRNRNSYVVFC